MEKTQVIDTFLMIYDIKLTDLRFKESNFHLKNCLLLI